MKLAGYALAVLGAILIIQASIFTSLGWDSKRWEKYPLKDIHVTVNGKGVGSANVAVYFVEATYQFLLDGNLKDGRTVTFGKNSFRDYASAIAYMNYVKKGDVVYYNRVFNLSCLNNDVSNPIISIITGVFLLLISRICFLKK
jgi:hypothetical protein